MVALREPVVLAHMWLADAGRVRLGLKPSHPLF